ncbi:MAG TPA: response regulator [Puia sp.]|jgi:DNA-binding NarL/FixJ family response regulator
MTIKKVLIAEDHESANISVQKTLEELGITQTDYVYYCDDALTKIQKGKQIVQPYDLLITDLYFEEDHRKQDISGGMALITAAREIQPDLKVLVFSAEKKPTTIETLFNKQHIDGYVRKARNDAKELKAAIDQIAKNQRYFPRHLVDLIKQKNTHQFTPFDVTILTLLTQGIRQKDIPAYLQQENIQPSGLSSIEKRLNHIKEVLDLTTNEQLIAYCKDMGIF